MKIDAPPRFALMLGTAQWQRCAFEQATLVDGVVQLGWVTSSEAGVAAPVSDLSGAGLAFDEHCRLFHSVPAEHRVERLLWDAFDAARPQHAAPLANLISGDVGELTNDVTADVLTDAASAPQAAFAPVGPAPATFTPRALACDAQDHLFVLDTQAGQVRVIDLRQRRILRSQALPPGAVDIAWFDGWLWGLSSPPGPQPVRLWRMSATRGLQAVDAPVAALERAARLTFARDGRLFVLQRAHQADASIAEIGRPGAWHAAPHEITFAGGVTPFAFGSDLVCVGKGCNADDEHLVVARRREEDFVRVALGVTPHPLAYALAEPLTARHYDGLGITATEDGRVVFWTAKGARVATASRLRYQSPGRVTGFRLDSGSHQTVWGRVLLDACIPPNTSIRVHCIVSDDEDEAARVARTAPMFSTTAPIAEPTQTPLPLLAQMPAAGTEGQTLFRRTDGSEQPWLVESENFDTFETPALATTGRYLWLVFDLSGHSRATPKLRGVRAEAPGHDWLRRLPQLYSRDESMRAFLQHYLAPPAGLEDDLAAQSSDRHALLKPLSVAAAALPWLANWIGLTLDERWSGAAKRTFIKEAAWLFRLRGTVWAVKRMIEIVVGAPVVLVEQFRLRGLGRIGEGGNGWDEPALLGMGFRVGGPVGVDTVSGDAAGIDDSFSANAHRFTVMVQAELDAELDAVVRHLLDVHRPAHTLFTLCSVGAGMRIGRGLQLELTSILGRSGGFSTLQLGAGTLGRGQVLGRAANGLRPGSTTLGSGSRIG